MILSKYWDSWMGRDYSAELTLPPLGGVVLKRSTTDEAATLTK